MNNTNIPKIIHYCWFGGKPLPQNAKKCIESWRKYLPDYEIREWNESNFDVNINSYTSEAYKNKKYAFVSDYARFWILYKYGGLYFDTDVEIIKNMDCIVSKGPFMGCESIANKEASPSELGVAPGLGLGVNSKHSLYRDILITYEHKHFLLPDGSFSGETVVTIITEILCKKGLKNANEPQEIEGIWIYPKDYFCPKDYRTGTLSITKNTFSIHHYDASWLTPWQKIKMKIWKILIRLGLKK